MGVDCKGGRESIGQGLWWSAVVSGADLVCSDLEGGFEQCRACAQHARHDRVMGMYFCALCSERNATSLRAHYPTLGPLVGHGLVDPGGMWFMRMATEEGEAAVHSE